MSLHAHTHTHISKDKESKRERDIDIVLKVNYVQFCFIFTQRQAQTEALPSIQMYHLLHCVDTEDCNVVKQALLQSEYDPTELNRIYLESKLVRYMRSETVVITS